jgi:hypothetical protein
LPGEPAGLIATRTAGVVDFSATLAWQSPGDVPSGPVLGMPRGFESGTLRYSVAETEELHRSARVMAGEIRAFTERELGAVLDALLRVITVTAALTQATLEVRAVRVASPGVAPPPALERLARDLWDAGFAVRFGRSWSVAPEAEISVGIRGAEGVLEDLLRRHPLWKATP